MPDNKKTCQMTTGDFNFVNPLNSYCQCGKPAKYKVPKPQMGVEYVCGIHAHSINLTYKRTNQDLKCIPL